MKLLKCIAINIITPLSYLINLSLETGIVAAILKISRIIALFKKGDTKLLLHYKIIPTLIKKELLNINKWFISNRLTLNINKTYYMLFNNKLSHINISINNINLTRVNSTEFVGIIDENLDWKLHILYLKNKLKKIIWIGNKIITNIISKFVNQKALLHVYNSIFLPHINYCIILWGNTYKTNTLCINILQKRIIRIIHNKPYLYHRRYPTKDLFKFNNILPFNDLVKYNTCEFMFKVYR